MSGEVGRGLEPDCAAFVMKFGKSKNKTLALAGDFFRSRYGAEAPGCHAMEGGARTACPILSDLVVTELRGSIQRGRINPRSLALPGSRCGWLHP